MTNIQLIEAQCRIEQVQTVLGFWLEGASPSNRDKLMIGAVMSLLNGGTLKEAHRHAVKIAAFVCSNKGAWPVYE